MADRGAELSFFQDIHVRIDIRVDIIISMRPLQDASTEFDLRILTGKKLPKIKLQHLQKIQIWTLELLVHQINSFEEVLKLEQISQKGKVVTGKTALFVICSFCSPHWLLTEQF